MTDIPITSSAPLRTGPPLLAVNAKVTRSHEIVLVRRRTRRWMRRRRLRALLYVVGLARVATVIDKLDVRAIEIVGAQ